MNRRTRSAIVLFFILMVVGVPARVAAQTPTPPSTPTPSVVETDDGGAFVFEPRITYGEAGVMVGLVLVAALLLLLLSLEVVSWFRQ